MAQMYQKSLSGLDDICSVLVTQDVNGIVCREENGSKKMEKISLYDTDGDGVFDLLKLEIGNYDARPYTLICISIDRYGCVTLEKCDEDPDTMSSGCKLVLDIAIGIDKKVLLDNIFTYFDPEAFTKTIKEYGVSNIVKTVSSGLVKTVTEMVTENITKPIFEETINITKNVKTDTKTGQHRGKGLRLFGK